jgi:hypothetical protein
MVVKHQLEGAVDLGLYAQNPRLELAVPAGGAFRTHTARNDSVAPEAVAAEQSRHIEVFAAYPPAERSRLKKRHIARKRAQIARMVRDALKFDKNAPQAPGLGVRRGINVGKRPFHQLGERNRGGCGGISRAGLGERNLTREIAVGRDYRLFDAAMLIPEKNLEIVNIFAHALETKVPRLDHARMNRADSNLMGRKALQGNDLGGIAVSAERSKLSLCLVERLKKE